MAGLNLSNLFNRRFTPRESGGLTNTLSGYFELRGERVTGWVKDKYGSSDSSRTLIEIFRLGQLIGSCAATRQPGHDRFTFSLPVEARFTGAELVREQVYFLARDSDGNRGRVWLDGAAQLELMREHLGVPATMLFDLDFSRDGNARPYLGAGWSGAEPDYTCTEDDDSFVTFTTPLKAGTYALRMTAGALIFKPSVPIQELTVFIDETHVGQITYFDGFTQFNELKFGSDAFAQTPQTVLRLHHPGAIRQSDLGPHPDKRRIAFTFKRLTLVHLIPNA